MIFTNWQIDKCPCVRYNVYKLFRRYMTMAAGFTAMQQHPNCCSTSAVACTSMRLGLILDTVILAVSIIIALILGILLKMV